MPDPIDAIARSLSADVGALSAIAGNVANIDTPGYRGVRATQAFDAAQPLRTVLDQSDGGLAETGRKFDLALRGPGFFAVQRDGQVLLARSGAFRVDAGGQLVTMRGDLVLGESGPIAVPAGELLVDGHGQLLAAGRPVDRLRIVAIADPAALRPAGDGAYAYAGATAEWRGSVVQGALERANVDPAAETVRLMETTRHAESVQRALSIYDQAMGTGINHLGDN
jgi:flagellar basal-body rod protein FlgG